jgi:hypothetical protein
LFSEIFLHEQLCESLFQHKAKMISLLDPHTHTYKLAKQADHVSDAEVSCRCIIDYTKKKNLYNFLSVMMVEAKC